MLVYSKNARFIISGVFCVVCAVQPACRQAGIRRGGSPTPNTGSHNLHNAQNKKWNCRPIFDFVRRAGFEGVKPRLLIQLLLICTTNKFKTTLTRVALNLCAVQDSNLRPFA